MFEYFNLCGTCQGMSNKVCTNRPLMTHLYQTGQLTENSMRVRHPGWPSLTWDRFQNYGEKENPCHQTLEKYTNSCGGGC